ncbi:hypothetical protein KQI91_09330 [Blautia sp. MSJ-19]|nr:hypothetical protein [Blautia sp. MSJ-19]
MKKKRNRRKKRRDTIAGLSRTVVFLALFCVFLGMLTFVAAKYIRQTEKTSVANAQEFYFTSDLLDGNVHQVSTQTDGMASVTLTLMNHADELRYSEVDIAYTVTVTDANGNEETGITVDPAKGSIAKGENHDAEIKVSGLKAGEKYVITASTDNTYAKTLTGTVSVNAVDSQVYASVKDGGVYIEVTVWTTESSVSNMILKYCAGLIPDNTDTQLKNAVTASTDTSIQIGESGIWTANTSHVYRFFKSVASRTYKAETNGTEVTVSEAN